jgi:hypothetical protein
MLPDGHPQGASKEYPALAEPSDQPLEQSGQNSRAIFKRAFSEISSRPSVTP